MIDRDDLPVVRGEIVWDPENRTWQLGVPDDAPTGRCIVHAELDLSTGGFNDMTIRDFIAARLEEDEQIARNASMPMIGGDREVWTYDRDAFAVRATHGRWNVAARRDDFHSTEPISLGDAYGEHIARHQPTRALRQVAAGRDVLQRHFNDGEGAWPMACIGCPDSTMDGGPTVDHVDECPELQALAFHWSDDEDWDIKWCPHVEGRRVMEVTEHRDSRPCYTNACVRCGQGDGWHYGNPAENA